MGKNLLTKIWDLHRVRELPSGETQLFIGLHLIHEVTSPQAFEELRERNLTVRCPERTCAVIDHVVPTDGLDRPLADPLAESMFKAIEGQHVPDVVFKTRRDHEWVNLSADDVFAGKTVIVFSLPGAFTPTCSSSHVPRYNQLAPLFRARGVDDIVCVSVNDAFVMDEWKRAQNADRVTFLPDGNGEFTDGMGLLVGKEDLRSFSDSDMMVLSSNGILSDSVFLVKLSNWVIISFARLLAVRTFSRFSRISSCAGTAALIISVLPKMMLRMLLKSWAIPPAKVPIASIF